MPQPTIAVVAKHTAYPTGFVIVIDNKWFIVPANHALRHRRFDVRQKFIRNYAAKFSTAVGVSVLCAACATPAIQPVPLSVVRWEELHCGGLRSFAASAGQQFHALSDNAFRVGFPFSSFIGPGIPDIRAQKLLRRAASFAFLGFGAGGFSPGLPGFAAL